MANDPQVSRDSVHAAQPTAETTRQCQSFPPAPASGLKLRENRFARIACRLGRRIVARTASALVVEILHSLEEFAVCQHRAALWPTIQRPDAIRVCREKATLVPAPVPLVLMPRRLLGDELGIAADRPQPLPEGRGHLVIQSAQRVAGTDHFLNGCRSLAAVEARRGSR
jgi:hypothetical protein